MASHEINLGGSFTLNQLTFENGTLELLITYLRTPAYEANSVKTGIINIISLSNPPIAGLKKGIRSHGYKAPPSADPLRNYLIH